MPTCHDCRFSSFKSCQARVNLGKVGWERQMIVKYSHPIFPSFFVNEKDEDGISGFEKTNKTVKQTTR